MAASLADRAYDLIKQDIIACVLEPGQAIVQMRLAEKYGLGLTPVREALQRLSEIGWVQFVPGVGFGVSTITLSDLQEMFELRQTLELSAVRLAVLRASDEQLRAIADNASFRYTYQQKASYPAFLAMNTEFHRSIALAGGNKRLADAVSRVHEELTRVFHLSLDLRDSADEKSRVHHNLAQALCDRDLEKAIELMQFEIDETRERVWEALQGRMAMSIAVTRS